MNPPAEILAEALATLTGQMDALVSEITRDANAELAQAQNLISQAIGNLDGSFSEVSAASQQQLQQVTTLVNQLQDAGPDRVAELAALERSNVAIRTSVADAVRALQFEDMVRQIIEHITRRMQSLSQVTMDLAQQAAELHCTDSLPHCAAQLSALCEGIARQREQLSLLDHRTVVQHSMDSGEIELF